jgi:hypothetical protein
MIGMLIGQWIASAIVRTKTERRSAERRTPTQDQLKQAAVKSGVQSPSP